MLDIMYFTPKSWFLTVIKLQCKKPRLLVFVLSSFQTFFTFHITLFLFRDYCLPLVFFLLLFRNGQIQSIW